MSGARYQGAGHAIRDKGHRKTGVTLSVRMRKAENTPNDLRAGHPKSVESVDRIRCGLGPAQLKTIHSRHYVDDNKGT